MNCDILKSKLIVCEWNDFYFIEIAFIGFTFDEIKQCIVFFGTPGIIDICIVYHMSYEGLGDISFIAQGTICRYHILSWSVTV